MQGHPPPATKEEHAKVATTNPVSKRPFADPLQTPDEKFLKLFGDLRPASASQVKAFPAKRLDEVVSHAGGPKGFLTSSQCLGCHGASDENMGVAVFRLKQKADQSFPYTEWRASMMGLAGRDPIFHAQLESEKSFVSIARRIFRQHLLSLSWRDGPETVRDGQAPTVQSSDRLRAAERTRWQVRRAGPRRYFLFGMSSDVEEGLGTLQGGDRKFKLDEPNVITALTIQSRPCPMKRRSGSLRGSPARSKRSALCGSLPHSILPVFDSKGKAVLDKNLKPKEFHGR